RQGRRYGAFRLDVHDDVQLVVPGSLRGAHDGLRRPGTRWARVRWAEGTPLAALPCNPSIFACLRAKRASFRGMIRKRLRPPCRAWSASGDAEGEDADGVLAEGRGHGAARFGFGLGEPFEEAFERVDVDLQVREALVASEAAVGRAAGGLAVASVESIETGL